MSVNDVVYNMGYNDIFEGADEHITMFSEDTGALLIAAFVIVVGFVAFKLIKRALNKA